MTAVAGVVITHGPNPDLADCLAALAGQVEPLVVVRNIPGDIGDLSAAALVLDNERPLGYAANANLGVAATDTPYVIIANPDAVAGPGVVAELARFLDEHPEAGIAGPLMRYPDGEWQPTRRRFPTVLGTVVRRSPLRRLRAFRGSLDEHYQRDDRHDAPVEADWLLGGFLCLRRTMLEDLGGMDEGFRLYCEDIDLGYRAALAGWERWYVPTVEVVHRYAAVIDKRWFTVRTWWHLRGMVRFIRKHPRRLLALR